MGTYQNYMTDPDLEKNGVLLDLGVSGTFRVARAGGKNTKYQDLVRRLTKPYRRQIVAGTLDNEIATRLTKEAFSKTIVLGWLSEGDDGFRHPVTGPDGIAIPFSPENALKLLVDLDDLFQDIKDCAEGMDAYMNEVTVAEGEHSPSSSDTP